MKIKFLFPLLFFVTSAVASDTNLPTLKAPLTDGFIQYCDDEGIGLPESLEPQKLQLITAHVSCFFDTLLGGLATELETDDVSGEEAYLTDEGLVKFAEAIGVVRDGVIKTDLQEDLFNLICQKIVCQITPESPLQIAMLNTIFECVMKDIFMLSDKDFKPLKYNMYLRGFIESKPLPYFIYSYFDGHVPSQLTGVFEGHLLRPLFDPDEIYNIQHSITVSIEDAAARGESFDRTRKFEWHYLSLEQLNTMDPTFLDKAKNSLNNFLDDLNFGPAFVAIWLSEKTTRPELRKQLLNIHQGN